MNLQIPVAWVEKVGDLNLQTPTQFFPFTFFLEIMLPSELEELIEQAAREEWEKLDLSGKGIELLPAAIASD